jgi:flagellum-specific ATP synthase
MTVAEYFRDCGHNVLLLMDSITRFCQALREIALAAGEPPASRGYPPTVFSELPRLLERAGPGLQLAKPTGLITAFFSVLVEGEDYNDPVADNTRGLLDGHIILDRRIAEQGRFPAVDVLRSLSRAVPGCNTDAENKITQEARNLISNYADALELIRLGAYRSGIDPNLDKALSTMHGIESILRQRRDEHSTCVESFSQLEMVIR